MIKALTLSMTLLCLSASLTFSWAQEKSNKDAHTGRSMDILAYCRKAYGDSAGLFHIRSKGDSWHCTLGKRKYPVDMNDVCRLQYGDSYYATLANPADSYTWSCNKRKAPSKK